MSYFKDLIQSESEKEYYKKLHEFIDKEYETKTIFPPRENIFFALIILENTDFSV